ncbi:EAL and HDOD domain-containing protein [Solicola sp. PLA-1-18]|uniref:EAL and HDOD domain-containing protein n=1 Tax=Solicola sp. PLA-1-18 TaxID=3380532 RepID=UPI003B820E70
MNPTTTHPGPSVAGRAQRPTDDLAASPVPLHTAVVARQPIVDRDGAIVAYELLFRSDDPADYQRSGEHKTLQVITGTIAAGIERMSQKTRLFCNADRGVLTGETPLVLPPHSTTIEVLETVSIDDEVVAGCRALIAQGYQIALDDFVWAPRIEELLGLASVVKIDLVANDRDHVLDLVARCRPLGPALLAEKVETPEQLAWAKDVGFDLFQGYVIDRPQVIRADALAPSTLTMVQLAAHLASTDVDFGDLEAVLRSDPSLSLQVLQLAAFGADGGMKRAVRSVHEALVLMGTSLVAKWASLALLSATPVAAPDGYLLCLVRARACELLARADSSADEDFAFTAGLLSSLDLLLGVPASELAGLLEIDHVIKAAAFDKQGVVGEIVARVAAYELSGTKQNNRPADSLDLLLAQAFAWALDQLHLVAPDRP